MLGERVGESLADESHCKPTLSMPPYSLYLQKAPRCYWMLDDPMFSLATKP